MLLDRGLAYMDHTARGVSKFTLTRQPQRRFERSTMIDPVLRTTLCDLKKFVEFSRNVSLVVVDDQGEIVSIADHAKLFVEPHPSTLVALVESRDDLAKQTVELEDSPNKAVLVRLTEPVSKQTSNQISDESTTKQFLSHTEQLAEIGCFDWNIRTNEVKWTDGLYRIYGLDPDSFDATLEAFLERVIPEDRAAVQANVQKALETRGSFSSIERITHSSGKIKTLESRGQVVCDDSGQPVRLIGVCSDVSRRAVAEEAQAWKIAGLKLLATSASEIMAKRNEQEWHPLFSQLAEHLSCDGFTNYEFHENHLRLGLIEGFPPAVADQLEQLQLGQMFCGKCAQTRQMIYASNETLERDPLGKPLWDLGIRTYVAVPLISDDRLLGTLAFVSRTRSGFEDFELDFIQTIAQLVASAKAQHYYEKQIRERDHRIRALFDNTADSLCMHDMEGRVLDVNQRTCEALGYEREELLRMRIDDVEMELPENWREEIPLLNEAPSLLTGRQKRKDGSTFPVEILVRRVIYLGQYVVLASARDMTERMEMERQKRRAEEISHLILRHAKMVTWEAAPNSLDFSFVHGSCVELLGFSETEWLNPGFWQERLHTEDAKSAVESLKQAALGNQRLEYRMLHKDGHEVWIETIVEPVHDEESGEFAALRGVLSDITGRKRLEDKLRHSQKMEAVGRLAGGVAHDFNNLLTVINAYAELLRLDMENEEARQSLKAIQDAANRASNLTAQLLMFARTSVNNVQVVNVNSAVKSSEPLLRRLLGSETTLEVSLQPGLPYIKADTSHLDQVLVNLTVNARDAMPEGGVFRIETSLVESTATELKHNDLSPGKYVAITVSDSGAGMSEETRAMAFEPFYTTKPVGQGTGLGLAVVYGVVRDCGGTITVSSTVGEGTTITILFPATEETPSLPPKETPLESTGSELILLVEDEESVRRAASATLRRHGYEVLEANGAQQALSLTKDVKGEIALLLTDMAMPGTNGLELANTIRGDYPNVRVLCMSGYSHDIFQRRDSAHAFLQKPFTGRGLVSKVREVLDESSST